MTTMLLGGLWHGANWTFVAWGGLHGLYLGVERALRARFAGYRPGPVVFVALGLLTYTLVNVTWVFFRAKTFGKAWLVLRGMAGQNGTVKPMLDSFSLIAVLAIVGGMVLTHWLMRARTLESVIARAPAILLMRRLGAARLRHHHCPGGRQCLHLFPVLTPSAGWLRVRLANALLAGRRCTIATRGRPRPTVPELRSRCRCGRCPSSPGAGSSSARWCCWHCCSPGGKRTGVASVSRPASRTPSACGRFSAAASTQARAMRQCCWERRGCFSTCSCRCGSDSAASARFSCLSRVLRRSRPWRTSPPIRTSSGASSSEWHRHFLLGL